MALLRPGDTCWRLSQADKLAFLVDVQDYFTAVRSALVGARRSVLLLGWSFDPRTRLQPDGFETGDEPDEMGRVLIRLARERPEIDIRVLIWKSALPIAASQEFFPHKAQAWFLGTGVRFRLDDAVPLGGCHHQKVLVVDDQIAFCSGGDFCTDRWDTPAHLDVDARRIDPSLAHHPPRHEVTMLVQGGAAKALGDLARERWRRATGDVIEPCPEPPPDAETAPDPWPSHLPSALAGVQVAVVRTEPAWAGRPLVDEWLALTLSSIAAAKRIIYLENQYFTSPIIAEALADRLAEPNGPEVVIVSTAYSPSYFDKLTMDRTRSLVVRRLRKADAFGRFRAYCPHTASGRPVIVHAKVSVIDDRLARIGSANLNNRSGGLDTECELAVEVDDEAGRAAIAAFRDRLVGHYFGRSATDVAGAIRRCGGLIGAIDHLNTHGRLQQIQPLKLGPLATFVAAFHLGDPMGVGDLWRLGRRKRMLDRKVRAIAAGDAAPALAPRSSQTSSKSITSGK